MNYYIVTSEVFGSLIPGNIQFAHRSQDNNKWVVTTTETIVDVILTFNSVPELSAYTFDNHADWTGGEVGIDEWDIEETEYLNGL